MKSQNYCTYLTDYLPQQNYPSYENIHSKGILIKKLSNPKKGVKDLKFVIIKNIRTGKLSKRHFSEVIFLQKQEGKRSVIISWEYSEYI